MVRNRILENRPDTGTNDHCSHRRPNVRHLVKTNIWPALHVTDGTGSGNFSSPPTHTNFVQFAVVCLRLDNSVEVSSDFSGVDR